MNCASEPMRSSRMPAVHAASRKDRESALMSTFTRNLTDLQVTELAHHTAYLNHR